MDVVDGSSYVVYSIDRGEYEEHSLNPYQYLISIYFFVYPNIIDYFIVIKQLCFFIPDSIRFINAENRKFK